MNMHPLPALTISDVERWVGPASFQRGQSYFKHGHIFNTRCQGSTLKAQCHGSQIQPYRVEVTLGPAGIASGECSCPVGGGGHCKHAAALLLEWVNDPSVFQEVPELETLLAGRSQAELIALICKMLARYPDLEALLELPTPAGAGGGPPLDPELIRRQVRNAFHGAAGEWGAVYGLARELLQLVELGDAYAGQQNWRDAATLYETVIQETLENYGLVEDEAGDLHEVVNGCVSGLGECLEATADSAQREAILRALFDTYRWDVDFGGIDMGYEAPAIILQQARPAERVRVIEWVRAAIPGGDSWGAAYHRQVYGGFILDLEGDQLDDAAFLRICRETGRLNDLVERLLSLGRVDEAAAEARQAGDYPLLGLAPHFVGHGQGELMENIIRERLPASQDSRLSEWLCNRYQAQGRLAEALPLEEGLFWRHPDTAGYQRLKELAQAVGTWGRLRPELMARLKHENRYALVTQIHLLEGEVGQALESLPLSRSAPWGWGYAAASGPLSIQVARAAEAGYPRQAMQLYTEAVNKLIEARGRENYTQAAAYLVRVRELYQRLGELETWQTLIADIRQQNRRLRALQEELTQAGL